ncbi:phenylalanine--tRNA ligase subunit beta [Wenzhouxiangella sp. XN79A]|uniref:phenylalanine--tRNA ligase subunit beta n=1 Tax=Wenzhouxiangella sp. XN79A TaxID=2724193 RepID=UPI00144A8BA9|nr:phenylalanine--tRNA ligase subunit beta [Wenzhouxiangella sp. XN79A]NKI33705.1 phenylalanine--tRNA ligase subunit beta [Wenzhouxiangella sp. XN79A]
MRFSYQWLTEWVDTELTAEQAAERLTAAGLEVDELVRLGGDLDGVVVGRIDRCEPHPDADRLKVCSVDIGADQPLQIVCGAPNARAGLRAPVATVGSRLPGGLKIRAARLRGVESAGMLCSAPELEIGEDASGLLELADDLEIGMPLHRALGLPDHAIELDLTPNRADCLSIRGIAGEFAALGAGTLRPPRIDAVATAGSRIVSIELAEGAGCPRYVGRVIEGVDPSAPTPPWMVQRLERCGVRSLGPIVDVTNYVLLEFGQPMHAFDLDRLDGGIRVRRAVRGETLELLNDQTIELDEELLVIADHGGPVALAGIMGGRPSSVQDDTRDILLESAWFDPAVIIGKARRFGLATDSSHRFERGVDPELQQLAIERATRLIVEIAGGTPGPVLDRTHTEALPARPRIELRPDRVNRVLGTVLDPDRMREVLERLGMAVDHGTVPWAVVPPSRRRDLAIEEDLIEEIARVVGYDRLPVRAPGGRLRARVASESETPIDAIGAGLQARGFQEIISWSFVGEQLLERFGLAAGAQPLANPLSQDMGVLRTSLVPGLVQTVAANLRKQQARIKLYETGHVFRVGAEGFEESHRVGLALAGRAVGESWTAARRDFDFFDLKGEVEQMLALAGLGHGQVVFRPTRRDWLHPGQSAEVLIDDETAGTLGQLHPALVDPLGLAHPVFVAELELAPIRSRALPEYGGLSRFPSVRRDLALAVPEDVAAAELVTVAKKVGGDRVRECIIFDTYEGKGIESGFKGIAIGLILRDVSRTLTDQDADRVVTDVMAALNQTYGVSLRG